MTGQDEREPGRSAGSTDAPSDEPTGRAAEDGTAAARPPLTLLDEAAIREVTRP